MAPSEGGPHPTPPGYAFPGYDPAASAPQSNPYGQDQYGHPPATGSNMPPAAGSDMPPAAGSDMPPAAGPYPSAAPPPTGYERPEKADQPPAPTGPTTATTHDPHAAAAHDFWRRPEVNGAERNNPTGTDPVEPARSGSAPGAAGSPPESRPSDLDTSPRPADDGS
jgi:hypothetical protein